MVWYKRVFSGWHYWHCASPPPASKGPRAPAADFDLALVYVRRVDT